MRPTADFLADAQRCLERVVRPYRRQLLAAHGNVATEIKADHTPVTRFDTELEQHMRQALTELDGSIGFEGEELGKSGGSQTYWLLDPIDGTESFVRGLPFVRNMATLVGGNQPIFTFIYNPISDDLFTARQGGGAFKNGQPIRVSQRPLDRAWVEVSGPLRRPTVARTVQALAAQVNSVSLLRDFTLVAEGKLDGQLIYESGGQAWDYAPRALLISEAGGRVANIGSDQYDFRQTNALMTNPLIFEPLMTAITDAMQGEGNHGK